MGGAALMRSSSQRKHRKKGLAEEALAQIQALYRIEKEARELEPAARRLTIPPDARSCDPSSRLVPRMVAIEHAQ